LDPEICKHLETLQNSFKSYFHLDGIIAEPWISNSFLSDVNCIKDVDPIKDELIHHRTKYYCCWRLTQKALENSGVP
jgi:hypothetical protein